MEKDDKKKSQIAYRVSDFHQTLGHWKKNPGKRNRRKKSLDENGHFLSSIFSSIQDGLSILDNDLNIIDVNLTMDNWYSHARPLVGKKCYEAYHGRNEPCQVCPTLNTIKHGKAAYEVVAKRGVGEEIIGWLDLYSFPLVDPETGKMKGVIEYVRDITERKKAEEARQKSEEAARRLAQENAIMAEIGRIISSTLNVEEVYDRFVKEVNRIIPFDRISINLNNPEEGTIINAYISGTEVAGRQPGDVLPLAGSLNEKIILTRKSLLIQTHHPEELCDQFPTLKTTFQAGLRSLLSVPLLSNDQVIGVLHFRSKQSYAYSETDIRLAESIAAQIAGAIANAKLFAERRETERALRKSEKEARRLAHENAIMAEIGQIICSTLNIETVYERFVDTVKKLIPFDRIAINIIHHEDYTFTIPYVSGADVIDRLVGDVVSLAGTAAEEILRTQSSLLIRRENLDEFVNRFPGLRPMVKAGFQSMIMVPLISQDKVIGILNMQLTDTLSYMEDELRLAEKVGTQIAGAIASAQLFHERQQAQRSLQESQEKYRVLIQNSNDAIFIAQDGIIKFPNTRTEELLGYSAAELARIPFLNHIHPDDRDLVLERHRKRLEGQTIPSTYFFRVKNRAGQELWVEINAVFMEWEGKRATLNFVRDVTEQKKLESQFLQAQKMEAVGRLAGGVAHDFNNLLTVINSHSELALMELKEWDPLRERFESIQRAGKKAADLTRQLLAFSRRQIVEMRVININTLIRDLEKMLRRVLGEDIELKTVLAPGLGKVKVDPGQIEQAILNLLVNAKDAMPSGGKILIETSNIYLTQEYSSSHMDIEPGSYIELAISDSGIGMTQEVKDRLFEPFFTTKEKGKGTGLGLSAVYGIVKQGGGGIWVYSEPGLGTTFKIYLPRAEELLETSLPKIGKEKVVGGKETILVVEDEEAVRKLIAGFLKKYGYKVLEASQAGEALLICEQCREPIHLLLTDVVMPGINGPDLAKRLSYFYPELRVVFMSGYPNDEVFQQGLLDGGMFFLQKPFTAGRLTEKIREVLDH
jgi:PAS domain S-box-containing protein